MTRSNEACRRRPVDFAGRSTVDTKLAPPRVRVIDADPALATLIEEWLGDMGCVVIAESDSGRYDLAIVDVPNGRTDGNDALRHIVKTHPGTPILALSAAFFPGVHACGPVAHALGVDCVLAKPATRDALTQAVRHLLPPPGAKDGR